jgi:hypothetical protein
MNTISTSRLSTIVGLQLPIAFLKSIGLEPAYEKHSGAMWSVDKIDEIILEIGLHFINRAETESSSPAPYGYKKNGEPSLKRGRKEKHVN